MSNPVTIVTAFFDINRSQKGDGRTIEEYKEWIKRTLQLNCNLFIVTEEKFKDFFIENRNPAYNACIKIIDFKELHYYKYYNVMKTIIESEEYKLKIDNPNRVECVLPEYNIIQYSKFHCLQMAIDVNLFQSDFFFWMDAGCSRFFLDLDISKPYPGQETIQYMTMNPDKFIIQKRPDLERYPIDENFIWKSTNLLYGTLFGGNPDILKQISALTEDVLQTKMLAKRNVNNEQLALAMVWKENPQLFYAVNASPSYHLVLFAILSL